MSDLAKQLAGFDFLTEQSKIELWLCAKDLKPVSAFPAEDNDNFLQWLDKIGLFFEKAKETNLYIASKNKLWIQELLPILFSNTKEDIEKKCELYGYPKETALAVYRNFAKDKDGLPVGVGVRKGNSLGITWWPYVRYVVRQGYEYEDSLIAKKWSMVIKRDLPEIGKRFENQLSRIN